MAHHHEIQNNKFKGKILKTSKENKLATYTESEMGIESVFSTEQWDVKIQWSNAFKIRWDSNH